MKALLKSLILHPTLKKYVTFRDIYFACLKDKDKYFSELCELYLDIKMGYDVFLTFPAIKQELTELQNNNLLQYTQELENEPCNIYAEDSEYVVYSKSVEKQIFETEVFSALAKFQQEIKTNPVKDLACISQPVDQLIANLHSSKNKIYRTEASTAGLLYGKESVAHVRDIYEGIVEKKEEDDFLYYTFGFKKFEPVKMARGDLVVIGGFTSHGKSLLLRNFVYRLLVTYGLNCYYCSLEMPYEKMKLLFLALHANNRDIYPTGIDVPYEKIKEGTLSEEEKTFLLDVVAVDFFTNPNYGTLYMEYPNKSRYRLSDVKQKVTELENTEMPIHAVAIDYITMLYPLESDKGTPDRQDYNQMIKEFKNMALSHRKVDGTPSPFLAITPAQISRGGLENAMKNDNYYDLSALREYSELESSADVVMTTMLLPDMRSREVMCLQNLKNRDGKVETEKIEISCGLSKGFNLYEHIDRSDKAKFEFIQRVNI